MRTLEIILWLIACVWVGWRLVAMPRKRVMVAFAFATIAIGVLHAVTEGVRVQMMPIYAVVAALVTTAAWETRRTPRDAVSLRRWARVAFGMSMLASLAVGGIAASMFPVFQYDALRGPYAIGTTVYVLKGAPRHRDLVVQAWYPSERQKGVTASITPVSSPVYQEHGRTARTVGVDRGGLQGRGTGSLHEADGAVRSRGRALLQRHIRRTNHVTFSDLGLIVRMPDPQLMNIRRAHRIINDYTVAFFERYLNGKSEALVDGQMPSPYEEVTVAARNVAPIRLVQAR